MLRKILQYTNSVDSVISKGKAYENSAKILTDRSIRTKQDEEIEGRKKKEKKKRKENGNGEFNC